MTSRLDHILRTAGGAVATHELYSAGITRGQIAHELRARRLLRARTGWYVAPGIHPDLLRAVRVGGRLTCRSALSLAGVWVLRDGALHVVVDGNDCQLRSPHSSRRRLSPSDAVVTHWRDSAQRSRLVAEPVAALQDLCGCATPEHVAAAADSLLHANNRHRAAIRALAARVPADYGRALLAADGVCESGTETLFWLRMRHRAPRRQVHISGVGDVDFLFGDRLVIEVDGEEFHNNTPAFDNDRWRDAVLSALGHRVLRFSYRQVMDRWPEVEAAVLAALARGDHY
jgi:very-short-patch-repair endonuclease